MKTQEKPKYSIPGLLVFTEQDVEDLMVTAMEGGSNYWYEIPKASCDLIHQATPEMKGEPFVMRMLTAISRGVAVQVLDLEDNDTVLGELTNESWAKGEKIMATQHREHYSDALSENGMDATTADVFFQLCLMGEIVYG